MISQPVPPFSPVLHCPLGLVDLQACPFPDVVFKPLPLSCLAFFPLSLCLARWFWPDLINRKHVHTTSVCVSLQWSDTKYMHAQKNKPANKIPYKWKLSSHGSIYRNALDTVYINLGLPITDVARVNFRTTHSLFWIRRGWLTVLSLTCTKVLISPSKSNSLNFSGNNTDRP